MAFLSVLTSDDWKRLKWSVCLLVCVISGIAAFSQTDEDLVCHKKGDDCVTKGEMFESLKTTDVPKDTVRVFTVASEVTDGYRRLNRSAHFYGIPLETLGMGDTWQGGDMNYFGGGYKVNLLKRALKPLKDDRETLVLFTDGYDIVFTDTLDTIVEKFRNAEANILFGAEHSLWPDDSVEHLYPEVKIGARFLNSGMFIGIAADVYEILKTPIKNTDDDQLYYTRAYLDGEVRKRLNIKLDHMSDVFQNLNAAIGEVSLKYDDEGVAILVNTVHNTQPAIIHGNGPSKMFLNNYGNYLAGSFSNEVCTTCNENNLVLPEDATLLPSITFALFIEKATPFLEEYFETILALDYPKDRVELFVHNAVNYHTETVNEFLKEAEQKYASVKSILASDSIEEVNARGLAVTHAQNKNTDYLFVVDADCRLDNVTTLRDLLVHNRTFISPKMTREDEVWSNFWGALGENGYYARSHDYMSIVQDEIRGIWNVPYITGCYLVKKSLLPMLSYEDNTYEPDMALCKNLRKKDIFMYTMNLNTYGHLVNDETFNPLLARPNFYMLLSNKLDWERRYIHPEYQSQLAPDAKHAQPCTDVFWFAIGTEVFCQDLVAIMENYGKWSDGGSNDERLKGGYEAVPTRDIHMNQVGLEKMWLEFLKVYVRPLQESVYSGYYHNPPHALMNFVVRYMPTEQPYLKPHHDTSTYTINIALNRAGIDYEGGGCRFLRYNCSVKDTKMGYMLMHPGRLTHFHEGLYTTNGTRYIMVSFVDP